MWSTQRLSHSQWSRCFSGIPLFFYDPVDVSNLISGSSAFSKSSLSIWKFTVHVLLKPGLENFEYYFASLWDECSCGVVWMFFGIAFLWDWIENWPFLVLWSDAQGFQLLHSLSNTCYFLFLIFCFCCCVSLFLFLIMVMPLSVRWYLIVVLIFFP